MRFKRIAISTFAVVAFLASSFIALPQANAQDISNNNYNYNHNENCNCNQNHNDQTCRQWHWSKYRYKIQCHNCNGHHRHMTRLYFRMRPEIRIFDHNHLFPRNVVIYDRDDRNNRITLENRLTGPNSYNVNRVEIGVGHDYFNRLVKNHNIETTNTISVNTGNNTISFNTRVGDISTGDVNISVR